MIIVLFCSCALCAVSGCTTPEEPGRYYNRDLGFSIIFPAGWEIQTMENGWLTLAVSDFESDDDDFAEVVAVDVYEQPQGYDLDNSFSDRVNNMNRNMDGFHEQERGEVTIDGERARWIIYSYYVGEARELLVLEYLLVKGKRAYVVSGDSPTASFYDFEEIFIRSARSFRFE